MFTEVTYATSAGSGRGNEDLVIAGPSWIVVLDGATAAAGVDSGCVHDVSWLVARLGGALAARLSTGRDDDPLADVLESAVEELVAAHGGTCDLGNPDSPSSTVAMARAGGGGRVDYLVLGDSPVVCSLPDGGVLTVADDRLERLPGGRPYSLELVRRMRNAPGGFWVAGARPRAARESVCGTVAADGVAVLTDGVARLVDWYGWSWADVPAALAARGPAALVAAVRELESARGPVWGKVHDDATVAWGRPDPS